MECSQVHDLGEISTEEMLRTDTEIISYQTSTQSKLSRMGQNCESEIHNLPEQGGPTPEPPSAPTIQPTPPPPPTTTYNLPDSKAPDNETPITAQDDQNRSWCLDAGSQDLSFMVPSCPRDGRMTWKRAVKKLMLTREVCAKVAVENKIGSKLEGWFRDVALVLQRGIAAEGRGSLQELDDFEAPEADLFNRCRVACGYVPVRYFAAMGLQDGLTEPKLALIGGQDAAGKSGSFFFLSPDQQLIAKSCTGRDFRTLLRILPAYTDYVEAAHARAGLRSTTNVTLGGSQSCSSFLSRASPDIGGFVETLLPRYLGLYSLRVPGQDKKSKAHKVLVMANVFGGSMSIQRRYDLKGSTVGRKASEKERAKRSPTLKDIDWVAMEPRLRLNRLSRQALLEAIRSDIDFLAKHGLMDYSLLIGVHDMMEGWASDYEAMNVVTVRDETRHCYLGIIDVLTPYRIKKCAETFFMGTVVCCRDISCQRPSVYARRFLHFVDEEVFEPEMLFEAKSPRPSYEDAFR